MESIVFEALTYVLFLGFTRYVSPFKFISAIFIESISYEISLSEPDTAIEKFVSAP